MIESQEPKSFVSVVIVTHNGREWVSDLLASLFDQDFPPERYQVIVVDNHSRDGTADRVAEQFPAVRLIRLDRNHGPGRALRHIGSLLLASRYMAYLNQDVVVHRRWLSELVEVMAANPQAGVVVSSVILPQWPEYAGRPRDGDVDRAYVCDFTAYGTYGFRSLPAGPDTAPIPALGVSGVGFLLDLQIRDTLGYLADPGIFAHADDMDLGLRVNAAGYQVLVAPRSVVYHDNPGTFRWDRKNLLRAYLTTQNTILAFYKVSYASEFATLLPRLLLGKMLKAGQQSRTSWGRVAYAAAAAPMAATGLVGALLKMPSFRERRRITMSTRVMPPGWLVERLAGQNGRSDPGVWIGGPGGPNRGEGQELP